MPFLIPRWFETSTIADSDFALVRIAKMKFIPKRKRLMVASPGAVLVLRGNKVHSIAYLKQQNDRSRARSASITGPHTEA